MSEDSPALPRAGRRARRVTRDASRASMRRLQREAEEQRGTEAKRGGGEAGPASFFEDGWVPPPAASRHRAAEPRAIGQGEEAWNVMSPDEPVST